MESGPVLRPAISSVSAARDFNGQLTSSNLSGVSCHAVIFSYAPPDMVRQAKLEAMDLKVRRKMLERKASLLDTHALSDLGFTAATAAVRVSARTNADAVGSLDLVKSLVVPPELTEHGDEVRGSSEFILDGERLEYQRPGRVAPDAAQAARPLPYYRTYEPGSKRSSATGGGRKKPWGVAEGGGGGAGRRSGTGGGGGGGGGMYGYTGGESGGAGSRAKAGEQELKAQLSDGMMSYVPSKFERPKGVESTAFVPQGQAMEEARHTYESVKQQRPTSAPPRRAAAAAAAVGGKGTDADGGGGRDRAGGDSGAGPSNGEALAGASAAGAGSGNGPLGGSALFRDKKYMDVPVVRVEETDLFAMYRQRSQQQRNPPAGPAWARSSSAKARGAAAAHGGSAATARLGQGTGGVSRPTALAAAGAIGRGPSGPLSMPSSRKSIAAVAAPAAAAANGPRPGDVVGTVRPRPTSAAPAPPKDSPAPKAPGAAKAPLAPATAAEAAALASGSAIRPWSSRPASTRLMTGVWAAPRPPSPPRAPGISRPPSQRRISAPSGGSSGIGAAAAAAAVASVSTVDGGRVSGDGSAGAASRLGGLQPLDPETRRQRQNRPGSAISTAKTNRVRGPARSGSGVPYGAATAGAGGAAVAAVAEGGGAVQPAWTTSSATGRAPCDRTQLQERILGGLVRQYTFDEEDGENGPAAKAAAAATAAAEAGGVVVMPLRRPVRPRVNSDAAGAGFGVGLSAAQRSVLAAHAALVQGEYQQPSPAAHAGRPQSAPNRRLRPPSPGHWAGRPDPETLLSRALQHSTTGIVYDPELQPSPLDSYMNQLHGLD